MDVLPLSGHIQSNLRKLFLALELGWVDILYMYTVMYPILLFPIKLKHKSFTNLCMFATVLDPRYKCPCFLTEDQKKTAYDEVKSHMDLITMSGPNLIPLKNLMYILKRSLKRVPI